MSLTDERFQKAKEAVKHFFNTNNQERLKEFFMENTYSIEEIQQVVQEVQKEQGRAFSYQMLDELMQSATDESEIAFLKDAKNKFLVNHETTEQEMVALSKAYPRRPTDLPNVTIINNVPKKKENTFKKKMISIGIPILLIIGILASLFWSYNNTKNEINTAQANAVIRHELVSKELGMSVDDFMMNQSSQQTGFIVKTKDNIYFADFKQEKKGDAPELMDLRPITLREAKYLQNY
ncbi:hypothetical protein SIM22_05135 [Bacillus cereus group sp. BfR-BA-01363]|uniref:hypothetical protein n=1 Tax=Bacillus cereus group sp. BfR-BA-01363 TaxID=3094882 RepID=UPI0029C2AC94|nr:hypothetical protein [Bacillus cereus group sp. BfR-BA-01363]MDX5853516.1 hypothetical protein [Bacillus cereus group sp. BfR-BA-01363]